MKIRPELLLSFLLVSCVYDPPLKGKSFFIQNQTAKPVFVIDSLTGNYFKLYDTAKVNNRPYIGRRPNFITEYGLFERFYSNAEMDNIMLKKKGKSTLYFVDQVHLGDTPGIVLTNHLYRSFDINIDTLKKYGLNHLFVTEDTILLEHDFDWNQ
jgi:hypothetical protein